MARIWKEANTGARYGDEPVEEPLPEYARRLRKREYLCVHVCSFTFRFENKRELLKYIAFYERKTQPTSMRRTTPGMNRFERWHFQRWHERLPLYLQERVKRERVVKALRKALTLVEEDKL